MAVLRFCNEILSNTDRAHCCQTYKVGNKSGVDKAQAACRRNDTEQRIDLCEQMSVEGKCDTEKSEYCRE